MSFLDNGVSLFGLQILPGKSDKKDLSAALSLAMDDDGATIVSGAGAYGVYVDQNVSLKNEITAIQKYREVSMYPELDIAIQDIVNEAIPQEMDSPQVTLNLDDLETTDKVKDLIRNEFDRVLSLLNYNDYSADIFRRWYVDGRIYYQVIVDKSNLQSGIQELRMLDAIKTRKVKEVTKEKTPQGVDKIGDVNEYYIYNENGFITSNPGGMSTTPQAQVSGVKISPDAIVYVPSGCYDYNNATVLSYLHKAIRPCNQLRMLEDATVVYFIARAPERRIFYVDVGNLPKLKAEQYLKDIMNKYRNKMVYDSATGSVRDDKKHMCLSMDTQVPLLDGRTLSIAELANEFNSGKENWAYSCDPVTGKVMPGLISWAGPTRKNAEVVRITLDNNETIVCTLDHKFPVKGKGFVEAQHLVIGESMIPLYRDSRPITKGGNSYERVFDNETQTWEYTHRIVAEWKKTVDLDEEFVFKTDRETKAVIHHRNYNRLDNNPTNLVRMNHKDHLDYHRRAAVFPDGIYEFIAGHCRKGADGIAMISILNSSHFVTEMAKNANGTRHSGKFKWTDLVKIAKQFGHDSWKSMRKSLYKTRRQVAYESTVRRGSQAWKDKLSAARKDKKIPSPTTKIWKVTHPDGLIEIVTNLNEFCRNKGFWPANLRNKGYSCGYKAECMGLANHKITNIEFLSERIDTGCITIDGDEKFHNNHTFALAAGIFTKNSMLEDFWMPRRDGGKGTSIETLPGVQNLSGFLDPVNYFQKKLYQALNIPDSRMQGDQSTFGLGRSSEITRDELKFQKFVDRLRLKFSQIFLDTLRIQLTLKGICNTDEWEQLREKIKVEFQSDNYFSELKESDILQNRLQMLQQVDQYLGKYFSKKYVQRKVLRMHDDEIERMDDAIADEKGDPTAQPTVPGMPPGMDPSMGGDPMQQGVDPSQQDPNQQDPYGQQPQQYPQQ